MSASSSASPAGWPLGATPPADLRPLFRVATFGLPDKFRRLAEIVLRHARHNQYRFVLSASARSRDYDIAVVDMTSTGGPQVAEVLRSLPHPRPVVRFGRRTDPARGCDDLLQANFALHLLQILNRVVEELIARHRGQTPDSAPNASAAPVDPALPCALVVDDSATVRRQMALALREMGLDSETVGDAAQALEAVARRRFDLVFVDVVMPVMDGYQLTRALKKDPLQRHLPVVILTGKSSPFDLARGALAGCNTYLVKPVALEALRETVARHLKPAAPAKRPSTGDGPIGQREGISP